MNKSIIAAVVFAVIMITSSTLNSALAGSPSWGIDRLVSSSFQSNKQTEPHIATRTGTPDTVVSAYIDENRLRCFASRSTDGGTTWSGGTELTAVTGTDDPVVVSNSTGKFTIACRSGTATADTIAIYTSLDGSSWGGPKHVATATGGDRFDKPWIAVDPSNAFKDRMYLCWTRTHTNVDGTTNYEIWFKQIQPSLGTEQLLASELSVPSTNKDRLVQGCYIDVGPEQGEVYVAWLHFNNSPSTAHIDMKRNDNGGASGSWFSFTIIGGSFTRIPLCSASALGCLDGTSGTKFRVNSYPKVAIDHKTGVHIAYAASGGASKADIFYINSDNCKKGSTSCSWNGGGPALKINLDGLANIDQWEPEIYASDKDISPTNPRGVIHVSALDRRSDGANVLWKNWHYHCHATDPNFLGCRLTSNWSNNVISDIGSNTSNLGFDKVGDYHGMTSSTTREAHTSWGHSTFSFDIYSDRTTLS